MGEGDAWAFDAAMSAMEKATGELKSYSELVEPFLSTRRPPDEPRAVTTAQPAPAAMQTRTASQVNATATAIVRSAIAEELAKYKTINSKELQSYADRHAGEKIRLSGRVFNVVKGADDVQMYFSGTYDALYVSFRDTLRAVYEGSVLTVYGEVAEDGYKCFSNAYGGEVCQPHLKNAFVSPGIAPATSGSDTSSAPSQSVATGPACPSNQVCISSPASGLVVTRGDNVRFVGTANIPNFARYQFLARDVNGSAWGHIADFTAPVTGGKLMDFFTGSVPRGSYVIRLQVIDTSGNIQAKKAEIALTIR